MRLEVFGSQARGDAGPDSDVDILVTFANGQVPGLDFFALALELETLFDRSVDLLTRRSVEQSANPFKRESILSTAEALYVAA